MRKNHLLAAIAVVAFGTCNAGATSKKEWYILGSPQPRSGAQWVRFVVRGDRDAPFPVIWVSPNEIFTQGYPEVVVHTAPEEFSRIVKFNEGFLCEKKLDIKNGINILQIFTKNSSDVEQHCNMSINRSCIYLQSLALSITNSWPAYKQDGFINLRYALKCKMPARL